MSESAGGLQGDGARHPLDAVLAPRAVAVIGASNDPKKRGFQVLRALRDSGFGGEVYPVNPKGGEILGFRVCPSVDDTPQVPDLALICTPAHTVPDAVDACGRRGVKGAVVLAVGFRESGEEGAGLERRLLDSARSRGIRVVGPNTSGILNLPLGLNLIGARGVRPGTLSLLVQSGNMALSLMNEVTARSQEGISVCVGVGNQTDLGFHEYLDFLGSHEGTRAVLCYVEGFKDARAFLEVAARVSRAKPVLVLKGARSATGRAAARSHTGSVAGEYDRLRAGLRQAGVVEV
ncbi:MAG: CoA-binding protein, partial [Gemmatimonadetes bacterium]|nr:CoA-binding protein [Gemmatimonadota bacterium]